ncbi:transposase [Streptomyces sp. NPDC059849]|uniref:transposase n=1 Tax=Streptomyces sp. NPDC059849 TaxID=3346969 RepID=UPI00365AFA70
MGRRNACQLTASAGHFTPDELQHLLAKSRCEADEVRDGLQGYVAEHLGAGDGILIIDDSGFVKMASPQPGFNDGTQAPPAAPRTARSASWAMS